MASSRNATRIEKDSIGTKELPASAYYGINALRGQENFRISGLKPHPTFIEAFAIIKKAAVLANAALRLVDTKKAKAIAKACDEIRAGQFCDEFIVDVFQMGAGTALHMNVNEVVANRALEIIGAVKGDYKQINPNDIVNFGQSTNDVFPTAIRVAGRLYLEEIFPVIDQLAAAFFKKGREFDNIIKSARTHLQDAVPIRLGQEFKAYGVAVQKAGRRLREAARELEELGLGGSAAGTGLNTHPKYAAMAVGNIRKETGLPFRLAADLREAMQSQRPIAEASSALKNLAGELSRIASDFRLLTSGPTTGFSEIVLPAVQAGSSIMPGKVNPSMAEMLNMVCFQVMGNDVAVTMAVQAGQLELNVMMPLMAYDLLFSIEILKNAMIAFTERCVRGVKADVDRCRQYAESSLSLATAMNPILGYARVAEVVKEALARKVTILDVVREKKLLTPEEIKRVFDVKKLTEPGVHT